MQYLELSHQPHTDSPNIFPIPRSILEAVVDTYAGHTGNELLTIEHLNRASPPSDPVLWLLSMNARPTYTEDPNIAHSYCVGVDVGATLVRQTIAARHGNVNSHDYDLLKKPKKWPTAARYVLHQYFEQGPDDIKYLLRGRIEKAWDVREAQFLKHAAALQAAEDPLIIGLGDALQVYALAHDEDVATRPLTERIATPKRLHNQQ